MKILFIQTGGTIDKDYPKVYKGYSFEVGRPAVEHILENKNSNFAYEILPLLQKDSLDLTEEDRKKIFETCQKRPEEKIIITHGTDTMIKTAKTLSELQGKTIVITGAIRPEKFSNSDAPFNVGTAIAGVQLLPHGVYIAMSGRLYPWDRCKKDNKTGQFVEIP